MKNTYNEVMMPGRDISKHNEKILNIVSRKNGKVLKYYLNCKTKLEIICSEGHEFKISPHKLYGGKWCSYCTRSISEEFTRFVFEKIFNDKFEKYKFWYKNHYIELDGFNPRLNIAFEYNGLQHYRKNEFIRTDDQLDHQQFLDSLKVEYCGENKINFIVIPFNVSHYDISALIKTQLGIESDIKIDYNNFSDNYSYIRNKKDKLRNYALLKNGKILEFGSNFVKLECARGHIWNSENWILKKGHWCKICNCIDRKQKLFGIDYSII